MADDIKKDRDNRDAESGRPVELEREKDDKVEHDKVEKPGEPQPQPNR